MHPLQVMSMWVRCQPVWVRVSCDGTLCKRHKKNNNFLVSPYCDAHRCGLILGTKSLRRESGSLAEASSLSRASPGSELLAHRPYFVGASVCLR